MTSDPRIPWLNRLLLRSSLSDEEQRVLLSLPVALSAIDANRDIVRLGDKTAYACLVIDGYVGRFGQAADGLRQISAVHLPGDMADLHSVVAPTATTALTSLSATIIGHVPHSQLQRVAEQYPRVARAFWRDCVADAAILAENALSLGRRPAFARLAHLLCELALRSHLAGLATDAVIPLPISQAHIGDCLGLTSIHVNRTLRCLREADLALVADRTLRINDWWGLARAGDFDPSYMDLPPKVATLIIERIVSRNRSVARDAVRKRLHKSR